MNILQLSSRTVFLFSLLLFAFLPMGWGNNIQVDDVSISAHQSGNPNYRNVTFTIRWDNSWNQMNGSIPNRDAAWIFIKYRKWGTATWHHAYLNNSGHSSSDCGSNCDTEIGLKTPGDPFDPADNPALGVFFYENRNNPRSAQYDVVRTLTLRWNTQSNSTQAIGPNDQVEIKVYAVEMAYVPEGEFTAGRNGATNTIRKSVGGGPYKITDTFSGSTLRTTAVQRDTAVISLDFSDKGESDDGNVSITEIDVPAGNDQVLLVGVAFREDSDPVWVSSVTFGGIALDSVVRVEDGNKQGTYIYKLFNPSGTNQTLQVNIGYKSGDKKPKGVGVVAAIFSGVESLGSVAASYGDKAYNHSVTISPVSDKDVVFDMIGTEYAIWLDPYAGQDSIYTGSRPDNKDFYFGASIKSIVSGTTDSMRWTLGDDKKAGLAAVTLKPVITFRDNGVWVDGDDGIKMIQDGVESEVNPSFPTGYKAFYCMKYEITQGQYASFLNTLTLEQQQARVTCDPVNDDLNTYALDAAGSARSCIKLRTKGDPFPAVFGCDLNGDNVYDLVDGHYLACNFLLWSDVEAWLDWAGLRPMTELEYEKACRGVYNNQGNETPTYPWGTQAGNRINSPVDVWESLNSNSEAPANGETAAVHHGQAGASPLLNGVFRVGGYARPSGHSERNRSIAGASLTGVLDLAGNVWEGAVSLDEVQGRSFAADHGDGDPSTTQSWPGYNAQNNEFFGIIRRGSAWNSNTLAQLAVSNRPNLPMFPSARDEAYGGRGVRSAN